MVLREYVKCIDDHGLSMALWKDQLTGDIRCYGDPNDNECDYTLLTQDDCYTALKGFGGPNNYLTCGSMLLGLYGGTFFHRFGK